VNKSEYLHFTWITVMTVVACKTFYEETVTMKLYM